MTALLERGGAARSALFIVGGPLPAEGRTEADGSVIRQGKFFEVGEYPDKQFALTEAEADAAVKQFRGGPINIEHVSSVLDGKLGQVTRLWRAGRDVMAEYRIPAWLHQITEGAPIRISSEWDRATKLPLGAAMVLEPRIADAVMMAMERDGSAGGTRYREETRMSLAAKLAAFLRGEGFEVKEREGGPAQQGEAPTADFRSSAEFRQMSAALQEQERVIAELRAQFAEEQRRADSARHLAEIQELVKDGKMTAAEADQWRHAAEEHPSAFAQILQTLKQRPPLAQFRNSATRQVTPHAEDPGQRLVALTRERMKESGERFDVAFSRVCRENTDLAAAHAAASPAYSGVEDGKAVQA